MLGMCYQYMSALKTDFIDIREGFKFCMEIR